MAADVIVLPDEGRTLAGLDALELAIDPGPSRLSQLWARVWPKAAAVAMVLLIWQLVVLSHWKPDYVLPGPAQVLPHLTSIAVTGAFWKAISVTLQRAGEGFLLAIVIGSLIGFAVVRVRPLRTAIGSLITGLQTMPSVTWFPFAIVLFQLSEKAILFVVILGAAPSIANGLITGVDYVPPLLLRSGRMLGARGLRLYRYVILPASLPSFVAGLKQGWAFAWRSLMAGELLVTISHKPSIGENLANAQVNTDVVDLLAWMIVLLLIGIAVDGIFGGVNERIRRRWGVIDHAA